MKNINATSEHHIHLLQDMQQQKCLQNELHSHATCIIQCNKLLQLIMLPINAHITLKSAFTYRKTQASLAQEIQPFLTKPTQR
jgi:hypothetical protein